MTNKTSDECKGGRRPAMTIWSGGTCTDSHMVGALQQPVKVGGTLHKLIRTCKSAQTRTPPWFEAHLYLSVDVDQETQKPYYDDQQLSSRSPDVWKTFDLANFLDASITLYMSLVYVRERWELRAMPTRTHRGVTRWIFDGFLFPMNHSKCKLMYYIL